MSMRTWLGDTPKEWADFNLCKCTSMEDLCRQTHWMMPAKVYSPSRERMAEFLSIMDSIYSMTWDNFWSLKIGDDDAWEDYNNTPTEASIEIMGMFGRFVDEVNKSGGI